MTNVKVIVYHHRGLTERACTVGKIGRRRPSYRWCEGYSENINGHPTAPWMTRRECQRDARARNAKAKFVRA